MAHVFASRDRDFDSLITDILTISYIDIYIYTWFAGSVILLQGINQSMINKKFNDESDICHKIKSNLENSFDAM